MESPLVCLMPVTNSVSVTVFHTSVAGIGKSSKWHLFKFVSFSTSSFISTQ